MNEGRGDTILDIAKKRIATLVGGVTWKRDTLGRAPAFDGSTGYVDLNNDTLPVLPATADCSLEARYTPAATGAEHTLFAQYISVVNNGRMVLRTAAGATWDVFLGSDATLGSVTLASSTAVAVNVPVHLILVRNFRTWNLYVNGVLEATTTEAGTRSILQCGNLYGARTGSATGYKDATLAGFANGTMSFVKYHARALQPHEAVQRYLQPFSDLTTPRRPLPGQALVTTIIGLTAAAFGFTPQSPNVNARTLIALTAAAFSFTANAVNLIRNTFFQLTAAAFNFTGQAFIVSSGGSSQVKRFGGFLVNIGRFMNR